MSRMLYNMLKQIENTPQKGEGGKEQKVIKAKALNISFTTKSNTTNRS